MRRGTGARSFLIRLSILSVAALLVSACGDDAPDLPTGDPRDATFNPDLGVDLNEMVRTDSGLYYEDREEGEGEEAEVGDQVEVHYTGWLPDGTRFDSSLDRGEPFDFTLGAGEVIPGWDEGVRGMREGGVRLLVIPSHLGYGTQGAGGVIPPNAVLVFEVELLRILEEG